MVCGVSGGRFGIFEDLPLPTSVIAEVEEQKTVSKICWAISRAGNNWTSGIEIGITSISFYTSSLSCLTAEGSVRRASGGTAHMVPCLKLMSG